MIDWREPAQTWKSGLEGLEHEIDDLGLRMISGREAEQTWKSGPGGLQLQTPEKA